MRETRNRSVDMPEIRPDYLRIGLSWLVIAVCFYGLMCYVLDDNEEITKLDRWMFSLEVDTCPFSHPSCKSSWCEDWTFGKLVLSNIIRQPIEFYIWILLPVPDKLKGILPYKYNTLGLERLRIEYEREFPCIDGQRIFH